MTIALNHTTANKTSVQTTDGTTTTTIHSWSPTAFTPVQLSNCAFQVIGTLIGNNNGDGAQAVSLVASATFTLSAGTLALVGSQTAVVAAQGTAGLLTSTITLDASSGAIRIRAKGVAGSTINWTGWLEIKTTTV